MLTHTKFRWPAVSRRAAWRETTAHEARDMRVSVINNARSMYIITAFRYSSARRKSTAQSPILWLMSLILLLSGKHSTPFFNPFIDADWGSFIVGQAPALQKSSLPAAILTLQKAYS